MLGKDADFKKALDQRKRNGQLRHLATYDNLIDFSSNDYLGIAKSNNSGSTGSRLISGNSKEIEEIEKNFASKLNAQASLYYGAGYLANIGLIPTVSDRFTTILSDELIHASLIDGIRLSHAKNFSFKHNDLNHLQNLLDKNKGKKIVVVETVYSMDGDSPDLDSLFKLVSSYLDTYVILDEAHGLGLSGDNNMGIAQSFINHDKCLAVVYPLGKAAGLSGAFVVGTNLLKDFLINFSRSFIYSTAPSSLIINQIKSQLKSLSKKDVVKVIQLKNYFLKGIDKSYEVFSGKNGAIVSVITKDKSKKLEKKMIENNLFVKAILAPTVSKGHERLRICFHEFNNKKQVDILLEILNKPI
jgi:8-amino-7-oxononanoate synthase